MLPTWLNEPDEVLRWALFLTLVVSSVSVGLYALAQKVRSRYARKRQKWSVSERPPTVPSQFRQKTRDEPRATSRVRTARIRPRGRYR
jgi:hypothetical protein